MFSSFEDDFKMYLKGHLACHLYRYSYVHLVKPTRGPRLADKYIIIVYIKTFKTQRNVQLKRLISYNFYVYCKNELTLLNIRSTFGFILCLVMVLYIILHHVSPLDLRSQLPGYINGIFSLHKGNWKIVDIFWESRLSENNNNNNIIYGHLVAKSIPKKRFFYSISSYVCF